VKRYGYPSKATARAAAEHASALLDLAADDMTRRKIGDLIYAAKRGTPLPAVEDAQNRLGLNRDPGSTGITVAAWLDTWLAGKRRAKKASTYRGYESHVRVHIVPVIGDLPLERLNAGHVEAVLAAVPGSPATRHRVFATLSSAMSAAVRQRLIRFSPCAGIELEPENPAEAQRWTPAQARRFITYAAEAGDRLALAYRVMVLRGCRRAELVGLRWAGADLDADVLTVAPVSSSSWAGRCTRRPGPRARPATARYSWTARRCGCCAGTARRRTWSGCWRARRGRMTTWCSAGTTAPPGGPTTCPSTSRSWRRRQACR